MKEQLKKNFVFLAQNLSNTSTVLMHLFQEDIISMDEKDIIESKVGTSAINGELVVTLMKKDLDKYWGIIKEIFRNTCNSHCATKIEETFTAVSKFKECEYSTTLPTKWWPEKKTLVNAFYERKVEDLLLVDKIKEQLSANMNQTMVIGQTASVSGMGGVGKTTVAKWFANHFQNDYKHIIWIDCGEGSLLTSFKNLARDLDLKNRHEYEWNVIELSKKCFSVLKQYTKCLVVFDNAECYLGKMGIRSILPKIESFHCIITSRNREWGNENGGGKIQQYCLDVFDDVESFDFLKKNLNKDIPYTNAQLNRLYKYLGNLPIALQIAVATLNQRKVKLEDYITNLNRTNCIILKNFDDYDRTINKTMKISLDLLRNNENGDGELAYRILLIFGYLRPDEIPATLFESIEGVDIFQINESLELLEQYSLITRKTKRGVAHDVFSIHRLLQHVIRHNSQKFKKDILTKILNANGFLDYKLIPYSYADKELKIHFDGIPTLLMGKLKLQTLLRELRHQEAALLSKLIAQTSEKAAAWYNYALCVELTENFKKSKTLFKKLYKEVPQTTDRKIQAKDFDEFGLINVERDLVKGILAAQLYLMKWRENKLCKAKKIANQNTLIFKNTEKAWKVVLNSLHEFDSFNLNCSENIIRFEIKNDEDGAGHDRNVKLAYMDFLTEKGESDTIFVNDLINLHRVSRLTLYCHPWKTNILLFLNSSIALERLSLRNIRIIISDGSNWNIKEIRLWSEINTLVKDNPTCNSCHSFQTVLPKTLERLIVNTAQIDKRINFCLPNLAYLQLTQANSSSVASFSSCCNLRDIYLLSCSPLDFLIVPDHTKRVKLWNTQVIRCNNFVLDTLIIGGYNWESIEAAIAKVIANNIVIYYDFFKEKDIDGFKKLVFNNNIKSVTVGNFFWDGKLQFENSTISNLVNEKSMYYYFLNSYGKSIPRQTFYEKFNI